MAQAECKHVLQLSKTICTQMLNLYNLNPFIIEFVRCLLLILPTVSPFSLRTSIHPTHTVIRLCLCVYTYLCECVYTLSVCGCTQDFSFSLHKPLPVTQLQSAEDKRLLHHCPLLITGNTLSVLII